MLSKRSEQPELLDEINIPKQDLYQNLKEFEIINQWLGHKTALINALDKVCEGYKIPTGQEILIADLGCGGGDLLRATRVWATKQNLKCSLFGLDVNPDILDYAVAGTIGRKDGKDQASIQGQAQAQTQARAQDQINYILCDVQDPKLLEYRFDIVCLNNVCHHFSDDMLVNLLKQLQSQTRLAIIINDLHRHWIPYYAIKLIVKLFRMSHLACYDGPLSVLKAFKKHELEQFILQSGATNFDIQWKWPFRWQVIIWNKTELE